MLSTSNSQQGLALINYLCYNTNMVEENRTVLVEKAKAIIHASHLPAKDKALLEGRIPFVADMMLSMFVQVCEEDPFGVEAIVKSMKAKLEAQGNLKRIHEIVKQERREIEDSLAVSN